MRLRVGEHLLQRVPMTNHPIARRKEIAAVYGAGLIQGVALVTFPAASVVFTSASDYGLSRTEYGGMFVPQAITAIGSALLGAGLARRLGTKRIYLDWTRRESGVDGAARSEPVRDERTCARLRGPARRHRLPRRRFRVHGADAQHVRRRVLSAEGGQGGVGAERPAGIGDRAGAGLCRGVRRSGHLVGTPGVGRRADPGVALVQCAIAAHPKPGG